MTKITLDPLDIKNKYKVKNLVIGQFDLIHYGHLSLFANLNDFSFLIFDNNPKNSSNLYRLDKRIFHLSLFNPSYIYVYDIAKNNVSGYEFINYLKTQFEIQRIIVGSDFYFGNDKKDASFLKKHFQTIIINKQDIYSSRHIKQLYIEKEIAKANELATIPYYFENKIYKNLQNGRKYLVKTANIAFDTFNEFNEGVYLTLSVIDKKLYKSISFFGTTLAFNNSKKQIETHILDFDQNIYGKTLQLFVSEFVRNKQVFNNLDELKIAILGDIKQAELIFKTNRFDKLISKIKAFRFIE